MRKRAKYGAFVDKDIACNRRTSLMSQCLHVVGECWTQSRYHHLHVRNIEHFKQDKIQRIMSGGYGCHLTGHVLLRFADAIKPLQEQRIRRQ